MIKNVYAIVDLRDESVNPIAKFASVATILNIVIPIITIGAGLVLLVMLLYAGFTYTTAGGDPEKLQTARKTIIFSIIGLIIIVAAFLAVNIINTVVGAKPL